MRSPAQIVSNGAREHCGTRVLDSRHKGMTAGCWCGPCQVMASPSWLVWAPSAARVLWETLALLRQLVEMLLLKGDPDKPKLEDLLAALIAQQARILACQIASNCCVRFHNTDGARKRACGRAYLLRRLWPQRQTC
jgi:hypothetical protein